MFEPDAVNIDVLKKRAYNLRWANVAEGIIPLTAADPDFPCAPEITEAINSYIKSGYLCYGPPEGLPEFKDSVARYFKDKRQVSVSPASVLPVDSAAFGIYLTCKAFLSAGDEAIIFDPVDFLFRYSIEQMNAKAIPFSIPPENSSVDFEKLEKLINKNTRMICLCNPLNPTGKVFTKGELISIGELACKYNLMIMADEVWSDIVFTPNVFVSIASLSEEIKERVVTITGFSKSYCLAGMRMGVVTATNKDLYIKLFAASMHTSTVHGANILSQIAASSALNNCDYWLNSFLIHLQKMRDLCVSELNSIPGIRCIAPQGCYVAFANIAATKKTNSEIHNILYNTAKVAVVPGLKEWFGEGAKDYIRLSFATSEEILKTALYRIKNTIAAL